MARISLYIPCFNGGAHLEKVLAAALSQTRPADEILVIDDGSTDDSREIAASFPVKIIPHGANLGLGPARNTALQNVSGELIAALDADVVAEKDWLRLLALDMETGAYAGAGGAMLEQYQDTLSDRWRAKVMAQHHGPESTDNRLIFGCNSLYPVSGLRGIGGYDPNCRSAFEDYLVWNRIRAAGGVTRYNSGALCYHQRRDTIDSVLDACYSWRLPGYERSGSFESTQAVAAKWVVSTNTDVLMIAGLVEDRTEDLAQLSLLGIFRHLLKDVRVFTSKHPEHLTELMPCVAGMLALIILDVTMEYPAIRRALAADLDGFLARTLGPSAELPLAIFREIMRAKPSGLAEQILGAAGIQESPQTSPLFVVLPWLSAELKTLEPALRRLETLSWELLAA